MSYYFRVYVDARTKNLLDSYTYKYNTPLKVGALVKVSFNRRTLHGIVGEEIKKPPTTTYKIATIKKVLSANPLIDKSAIEFCRWMSHHYGAPLGPTIFNILPKLTALPADPPSISWHKQEGEKPTLYIAPLSKRLNYYSQLINNTPHGQTILLMPTYRLVDFALTYFAEVMGAENVLELSDRLGVLKTRRNLSWIKHEKIKLIIGTRKTIFAPAPLLQRIIIDSPTNFGYYNEQTPNYRADDIALALNRRFGTKLVLGDAIPNVEYYSFIASGKVLVKSGAKNEKKATLIWQQNKLVKSLSYTSKNLRAIITPYANHDSIKELLDGQETGSLSSTATNLDIPKIRPYTLLATKKILDFPDLWFDEILISDADKWLSLPSHDASYDFITLVWRLWQQAREQIVIQSERSIPLIEKLLSQRPTLTYSTFYKTRHTFKLPPVTYEIKLVGKSLEKIKQLLPAQLAVVVENNAITAYFPRTMWPPKNIEELYRQCEKIKVNPPS